MSGEEVKNNIHFFPQPHVVFRIFLYTVSFNSHKPTYKWPRQSLTPGFTPKSWFSMGAIFKIYVYIERTNHYTYFKYELHVWNTTNQFTLGKVMLLVERFGDSYVKVIFSKWLRYWECSLAPPPLPPPLSFLLRLLCDSLFQSVTDNSTELELMAAREAETAASKLKVDQHRSSTRSWWSFRTVFNPDRPRCEVTPLSTSRRLSSALQAQGSIYGQSKTKWVSLIFQVWIHLDDSLKCVLIGPYW